MKHKQKHQVKARERMSIKGRTNDLRRRRDLKLLQRYYHLTEVQRRRFDDALHTLSEEEFFISETRILRIIKFNLHAMGLMAAGKNITLEDIEVCA